ncbi:hypothetical protein [Streptomyces sp. NBC_00453]
MALFSTAELIHAPIGVIFCMALSALLLTASRPLAERKAEVASEPSEAKA